MAQGQVRATHGDAADAAVLSRLWQQQEIRVADDWWVVLTTARRRRVRSIGLIVGGKKKGKEGR
jgi:hypothetical protein